MKKRKILYTVSIVLLVGAVLVVYNAFNGNPVSKYYASKMLENYLEEEYPEREFRIDDGFYNFKDSAYEYEVIEIGEVAEKSDDAREHRFTMTGFFKPTVRFDGVYNDNLDESLMRNLSHEAEKEILSVLSEEVPSVKVIDVMLEVQKGEYGPDVEWNKKLNLEEPIAMHMHLDATDKDKKAIYSDAIKIQSVLNKEGYKYQSVNINANEFGTGDRFKENNGMGELKFHAKFTPETDLDLSDVETYEQ